MIETVLELVLNGLTVEFGCSHGPRIINSAAILHATEVSVRALRLNEIILIVIRARTFCKSCRSLVRSKPKDFPSSIRANALSRLILRTEPRIANPKSSLEVVLVSFSFSFPFRLFPAISSDISSNKGEEYFLAVSS